MKNNWPNNCQKSVPAALRYLANHERPIGGESKYNSEHLYQLAKEIEKAYADDQELNFRGHYHQLLDLAMNETKEGDFFLPQFVRLLMLEMKNKKD